MKPKNIVLLIVFALIITFLAQNSEQTAIKFLFWRSGSLPRWLLLGGLLAVGFFSGWIFAGMRGRKKARAKSAPAETPPEGAPGAEQETT